MTTTSKDKHTQDLKRKTLQALTETCGIVSDACRKVNISRWRFYEWKKKDPSFATEVEQIEEDQIDFVESKLLENIRKGQERSIIFYLKCKGRKRGYTEGLEITGKDGEALIPEPRTLTPEELQALALKLQTEY